MEIFNGPLYPLWGSFIPVESPQPFALSTLPLQDFMRIISQHEKTRYVYDYLLFAGLACIIVVGVAVTKKWQGPTVGKYGNTGISVAGIVSTVIFLGGLISPTSVLCYRPATFKTSDLTVPERLRLLDDAEQKGEISEEAAEIARKFIGAL